MDKDTLNNLRKDEKLVEMKEFILHNKNVIEVTVYEYRNRLIGHHIHKVVIPFYFETKQLAEEFIKYWDELEIVVGKYFGGFFDEKCYMLELTSWVGQRHHYYHMVDSYKETHENTGKNQLREGGIWGGIVNTDGRYSIKNCDNVYFTEIFNLENKALETSKTYVFKMCKDE